MSATYGSEAKMTQVLQKNGVESYVPMRTEVREHRGRKRIVTAPAVSNLLFAHTSFEVMNRIEPLYPHLQYKIYRCDGLNRRIVVPDKEMEAFIAFTSSQEAEIKFIRPEEINYTDCKKVKIIGGPFDGLECYLRTVRGSKYKQLISVIEGLVAVSVKRSEAELYRVIE